MLRLVKRDFVAAAQALRSLRLEPRLPVSAEEVFDFRDEYIRNRNLIAWSFCDPRDPSRIVDIVITHDLRRLRLKTLALGGRRLPVLALPDLIAMKKASGRPQDLADIRALEELGR